MSLQPKEDTLQYIRKNLIAFTRYTKRRYSPAWFHRLLAKKYTALISGEILRIMLFMPPRHGKSELFSLRGPAWALGGNPDLKFIHAMNTAQRARSYSKGVRNLLKTHAYQCVFPGVLPAMGSEAADSWAIEGHEGEFNSYGVGSTMQGTGADVATIDDIIRGPKEARSEVYRASNIEWFQLQIRDRLHPGGRIGLLMTRWHKGDLAGWLMEESRKKGALPWEVVCIPVWDDKRGWLWPERYSEEEYEDLRVMSGKYGWAAKFMQDPIPLGTGMLARSWFRLIHMQDLPRERLRSIRMGVDLAASVKTQADYTTAFPIASDDEGRIYLLPPFHEQMQWPVARQHIAVLAKAWGCSMIGVETVAMQLALADDMRSMESLAGIAIVDSPVDKDKVARVMEWSPIAENGQIWLVEDGSNWTEQFLSECEDFPLGDHDDYVDAAGISIAMLRRRAEGGVRRRGG